MSRSSQLEAAERKVARYLDTLLSLNSTRILNDFDEIVRESGRRLEAEIRGMLNELQTTAETTLARAETTRAAGTEAVRSSLEHLERAPREDCPRNATGGRTIDRPRGVATISSVPSGVSPGQPPPSITRMNLETISAL